MMMHFPVLVLLWQAFAAEPTNGPSVGTKPRKEDPVEYQKNICDIAADRLTLGAAVYRKCRDSYLFALNHPDELDHAPPGFGNAAFLAGMMQSRMPSVIINLASEDYAKQVENCGNLFKEAKSKDRAPLIGPVSSSDYIKRRFKGEDVYGFLQKEVKNFPGVLIASKDGCSFYRLFWIATLSKIQNAYPSKEEHRLKIVDKLETARASIIDKAAVAGFDLMISTISNLPLLEFHEVFEKFVSDYPCSDAVVRALRYLVSLLAAVSEEAGLPGSTSLKEKVLNVSSEAKEDEVKLLSDFFDLPSIILQLERKSILSFNLFDGCIPKKFIYDGKKFTLLLQQDSGIKFIETPTEQPLLPVAQDEAPSTRPEGELEEMFQALVAAHEIESEIVPLEATIFGKCLVLYEYGLIHGQNASVPPEFGSAEFFRTFLTSPLIRLVEKQVLDELKEQLSLCRAAWAHSDVPHQPRVRGIDLLAGPYKTLEFVNMYHDGKYYLKYSRSIAQRFPKTIQVTGDGNCLYRAFWFAFFQYLHRSFRRTNDFRKHIIEKLRPLHHQLGRLDPVVHAGFSYMILSLEYLPILDIENWFQLFNFFRPSDAIVYALRHITSHQAIENEEFQHFLTTPLNEFITKRVLSMGEWGGHEECHCLVNFFEVHTVVTDLTTRKRTDPMGEHDPDQTGEIELMYNGTHFNIYCIDLDQHHDQDPSETA